MHLRVTFNVTIFLLLFKIIYCVLLHLLVCITLCCRCQKYHVVCFYFRFIKCPWHNWSHGSPLTCNYQLAQYSIEIYRGVIKGGGRKGQPPLPTRARGEMEADAKKKNRVKDRNPKNKKKIEREGKGQWKLVYFSLPFASGELLARNGKIT